GLDEGGASADGIAGSGFDQRRGDSPAQRVLEPEISGVDPVDRAQSGPVGIGHLVRVVSRPALTVLMHAEVAWASVKPGRTQRPPASMTAVSGARFAVSTAPVTCSAMRPSLTMSEPDSIASARFPSASATGTIRALVITRSVGAGT